MPSIPNLHSCYVVLAVTKQLTDLQTAGCRDCHRSNGCPTVATQSQGVLFFDYVYVYAHDRKLQQQLLDEA